MLERDSGICTMPSALTRKLVMTARVGCYRYATPAFPPPAFLLPAHDAPTSLVASARHFGSNKKSRKGKKRARAAVDTTATIEERKALAREKVDMLKQELDNVYEYPVIERRYEKGPESWAL